MVIQEEVQDANDKGGRLASENALCRDLDLFNQLGVCMGVIQYVSRSVSLLALCMACFNVGVGLA